MEEIISRKEAMEKGLKTYFTGKPCKNGHIQARNVRNGTCLTCSDSVTKRVYERHKKAAAKDRKNKGIVLRREAASAGSRRYFTGAPCVRGHIAERRTSDGKCMVCIVHKNRRRRKENPEYFAEALNRFLKLNPNAKRTYDNNRRARIKASGGTHTHVEINDLLIRQKYRCAYCFKSVKVSAYHVDHVIPLARGGGNSIENIQILCVKCNLRKGSKDPIEYANKELGRLL